MNVRLFTELLNSVETVLKMCGLEKHADAIVGTLGVEHRKRTGHRSGTILFKPELLLFLDEPKSGLDSQSVWAIVSFLRELANHGQAIPGPHPVYISLQRSCSRNLLLRKGGQTVYLSDIGENAMTLITSASSP